MNADLGGGGPESRGGAAFPPGSDPFSPNNLTVYSTPIYLKKSLQQTLKDNYSPDKNTRHAQTQNSLESS